MAVHWTYIKCKATQTNRMQATMETQVKQNFTFRITDALREQIKEVATRRRWSEAEAARYLVECGLKLEEQPINLAA